MRSFPYWRACTAVFFNISWFGNISHHSVGSLGVGHPSITDSRRVIPLTTGGLGYVCEHHCSWTSRGCADPTVFLDPMVFFWGGMGVDCTEEMKMKWELPKSISLVLDVAFSAIFSIASKNLSLSSIKRTIHPLLPRCSGVNAEPAAEYHSCLFSSLWDNCVEVSKGQNQG